MGWAPDGWRRVCDRQRFGLSKSAVRSECNSASISRLVLYRSAIDNGILYFRDTEVRREGRELCGDDKCDVQRTASVQLLLRREHGRMEARIYSDTVDADA